MPDELTLECEHYPSAEDWYDSPGVIPLLYDYYELGDSSTINDKIDKIQHIKLAQPEYELEDSTPQSDLYLLDSDLEQKFRRLADQWVAETEHSSSIKKVCMHPSYQRIIGMGPAVVPYLLRELETNPDHWFWALNAITEEDPAQDEDTFNGAVRAWLEWGRMKNFL